VFIGGIAAFAGQALSAAADGIAFFALAGVDYFIFAKTAKGAKHACFLLQHALGQWIFNVLNLLEGELVLIAVSEVLEDGCQPQQ
jgi:hypothetical protein